MKRFVDRHIGPNEKDSQEMLKVIGYESIEKLIDEVIPNFIQIKERMGIKDGISESEYLKEIEEITNKNQLYKSYIGMGYYNTVTPNVILRNLFENPGWYTQYTPYQAEISQGRLESLLNFQNMVMDLTGMEIANASLLDEATAAAEAVMMLHRVNKKNGSKVFVSNECFPQTIDLIKSRCECLEIEVLVGDYREALELNEEYFAIVVQYPAENGSIYNYEEISKKIKEKGIHLVVCADIMSLTLLKPPGEWGADVVVGNTQRFGVPLGYGGPHAAYIATKDSFKRQIPGRIIGVSKDKLGNQAYRMALQTREQHIKRDKATSNICTAQALLANMAAMYVIYHGRKGIKAIALEIHERAKELRKGIDKLKLKVKNESFFDTITLEFEDEKEREEIIKVGLEDKINFRIDKSKEIGISVDETTSKKDIEGILKVFRKVVSLQASSGEVFEGISERLKRTSDYLTHSIFNRIHSETQMMRYLNELEKKDISLNYSMISLGSCTMKLNAAVEMMPLSFKRVSQLHPFVPIEQALGYQEIIRTLENDLKKITGFAEVSLQPNSGAQGEYAGLLAIRNYFIERKEEQRKILLIPTSAHGTNPASAVMCGMKVVLVKCLENGDIDINDLEAKGKQYEQELAGIMVTYPSTHGVYEENIKEICGFIHKCGGQVYMDGANMNAQVGYTSPAMIGADVCHLNLHKTFAIPHGGGGPGMGPIAVKEHLVKFLPNHSVVPLKDYKTKAVSAAPWGSASILLISYGYIKLLGEEGLKKSTAFAILNANYMKVCLEKYYDILFVGSKGNVAHEMIIDLRRFEKEANVTVEDIAKRLIDYGFHSPTMSWPIAGTLMIEPTESESKEEIDRFCEAMINIRKEIDEIIAGRKSKENHMLKNAPHTAEMVIAEEWNYEYSREEAVFPLKSLKKNKFWPSVARINNAYGDRNFFCACPEIDEYND